MHGAASDAFVALGLQAREAVLPLLVQSPDTILMVDGSRRKLTELLRRLPFIKSTMKSW